jgi:thiamine biosynthesis lipoprotein
MPIRLQGFAQGTTYTISYFDDQHRDLQHQIDSLLADFDLTASLWVDSSLLCRVNSGADSIVNATFADILRLAVDMHSLTDGAFDCTVGKLVSAWGFGSSARSDVSDSLISALLPFVGPQPYVVTDSLGRLLLRKPFPETYIDFNAIAQGYSTDLVSRFLMQQGISSFIVNIGGEVFARGSKPDGSPWIVGIERPADNKYSAPVLQTSIALHDQSVVTSGNYRKYYEKDGMRYSHTINPATGRPVEHQLLSVSVIDTAAWRADALATAFMVMGLDRALEFIADNSDDPGTQAVFFIYADSNGYSTYATETFNNLISSPTH